MFFSVQLGDSAGGCVLLDVIQHHVDLHTISLTTFFVLFPCFLSSKILIVYYRCVQLFFSPVFPSTLSLFCLHCVYHPLSRLVEGAQDPGRYSI